jgi:hypothetical protein
MKITEKSLRRIIREELLRKSHAQLNELTDGDDTFSGVGDIGYSTGKPKAGEAWLGMAYNPETVVKKYKDKKWDYRKAAGKLGKMVSDYPDDENVKKALRDFNAIKKERMAAKNSLAKGDGSEIGPFTFDTGGAGGRILYDTTYSYQESVIVLKLESIDNKSASKSYGIKVKKDSSEDKAFKAMTADNASELVKTHWRFLDAGSGNSLGAYDGGTGKEDIVPADAGKGSLSSDLQLRTQRHMINLVGLKDNDKDRYAIKKILGCSSSRRCPDGKFGRRSAALWNAIQGNPDYKIQNVSSPLGELNGWRKLGKWQEAWTGLGTVDSSVLTKLAQQARDAVKKSDDKKKSLGKGEGTPAERVKKATKKLATDISALAKAINTEFNTGAWASVDMTGTEGFKWLKNYYKKRILKTAASLLTARDTFLSMPDRATLGALNVAVDDFEEDVGKDLDNMMGLITKLPESPSVNSALDAARSPGTTLDQLRRALTDYRKGNV